MSPFAPVFKMLRVPQPEPAKADANDVALRNASQKTYTNATLKPVYGSVVANMGTLTVPLSFLHQWEPLKKKEKLAWDPAVRARSLFQIQYLSTRGPARNLRFPSTEAGDSKS